MQRIGKETHDHKYFMIIQRYVWAMCRQSYDFTLWGVIKDIAGEEGECTLSTPDLATLCMMSVGMVSNSREYLLKVGLLAGELKRDPDYPQPVWHLAIPDLWQRNIEWSLKYPSLTERIAFKKAQRLELSCGEGSKKKKELSYSEKGVPPHEKGIPSGEKGVPPHETKKRGVKTSNNQENNPAALAPIVITQNDIRKQAETKFIELTGLQPIGDSNHLGKRWYTPLREICKLCQWEPATIVEVIENGVKAMQGKQLDITAPQSIIGYCNRYHAGMRGTLPHGANGSSLTAPQTLPSDILKIWTTIPLHMQKYICQNPTKIQNFKQALINEGLY